MARSRVLEEDLKYISESGLPFEMYRNSTFLVSGSTGLIGSLLIRSLLYCNQCYDLNLKIIGLIRSREKAISVFADELNDGVLSFIEQDLRNPLAAITEKIDYIIHTAAVTSSREMVQYPVDNICTSVGGTKSMLDLAKEKKVKAMVYISSMEVYGSFLCEGSKVKEDELGYIDLYSARSCYPESKRLCECLCNAYAVQYGVNVMTARLAQTFGAGILPTENRVFAQFARSVLKKENIVLHTEGRSEGNYVYTADAVIGLLLLLAKGKKGNAYNIANEESHMTIGEMAHLVSKEIAKGQIEVVYDIPVNPNQMGYAPDVKLYLSSEKMNRLGWKANIGLQDSYQRLIEYMEEVMPM